MKMIVQEITASIPTMAIINGKIEWFYTIFSDVKDDTDSIFIVVPADALISVNSISFNNAIFLGRCFGLANGQFFAVFWCFGFFTLQFLVLGFIVKFILQLYCFF